MEELRNAIPYQFIVRGIVIKVHVYTSAQTAMLNAIYQSAGSRFDSTTATLV